MSKNPTNVSNNQEKPKKVMRLREFFNNQIEFIHSGKDLWRTQFKKSLEQGVKPDDFIDILPEVTPLENEIVVPQVPFKEKVTRTGVQISMVSTFAGFLSSSLTAFNGMFSKLPGNLKIPFELHRGFYNVGSGVQALTRAMNNDPEVFEADSARESAKRSQVFNLLSGVSMAVVSGLIIYANRTPLGMLGRVAGYANSSIGFNITGGLNLVGAWLSFDASAKESQFQQDKLVKVISKETGITEEKSRELVLKTMPHVTREEELSRKAGLVLSEGGVVSGICSALAKNPMVAARFSVISGLMFMGGLILPFCTNANIEGERRFSDEKDERFKEIQQNGLKALIPAVALVMAGGIVMYKYPNSPLLQQVMTHGLHKADNSFTLLSVAYGSGLGTSTLAWREFYSGDQRVVEMRNAIEMIVNGNTAPTDVSGEHIKRLLEEVAKAKTQEKSVV